MPAPSPRLVAAVAMLALASPTALAGSPNFEGDVRPLIEKACVRCHGASRPKAGINLARFADGPSALRERDLWGRVAEALSDRSMPPQGKPQPEEAERQKSLEAIRALLAVDESIRDPGPGPIQRLTRAQYNNTIRDLLGVETRPADSFPADGGGGAGFDNNAATLFVPPILMEKYLAAAGETLDRADPSRWKVVAPSAETAPAVAARRCVIAFAARAFRRPATPEDVDRLMTIYRRAEAKGLGFDASVKSALKAALVSPRFLFLYEDARPEETGPYPIGPFELASRLSYFLWSSMPDDELFDLAARGVLAEPDVLERQVRRMLADPKSRALSEGFAGQWLGVNSLRAAVEPDRRVFPEYDAALRDAMIEEPVATFDAILRADRSLLDLIDCDYVIVNERLARHYGMSGVQGPNFREVRRTDPSRGGLLGMAGVLTLTSYPQRTSPVLRGRWVLDELLGTPPPPPPPDVKVLPPDDRPKNGATFRQRLEKHRRDAGCASCHAKLDPLGFGLETFDPVGRPREAIGGGELDASGVLTTGEAFRGPVELKAILKAHKRDLFVRNVASRMLGYALRRGLEPYDAATVRSLCDSVSRQDARASALIVAIARSYPFLNRRDEPVTKATQ